MIIVHFEVTAWEWDTLQTAFNDWQNANSEFLWVTSTLSAMWVEKSQGLKHKKFWNKNVNISSNLSSDACHRNHIYTHITPKPSQMLRKYRYCSRKWFFLYHLLVEKFTFKSLLWSFSTNVRFVFYSVLRMAPCF
jgi:hypothetical protein